MVIFYLKTYRLASNSAWKTENLLEISHAVGDMEGEKGMKGIGKRGMGYLGGGILVGIANGLFGGGGGMLAVPLLRANGLAPAQAHATAIAVILPASAVSGAIYFFHGLTPLTILVPVALGVALGGALGARLLGALSGRAITFLFALLMLAAGLKMLF